MGKNHFTGTYLSQADNQCARRYVLPRQDYNIILSILGGSLVARLTGKCLIWYISLLKSIFITGILFTFPFCKIFT